MNLRCFLLLMTICVLPSCSAGDSAQVEHFRSHQNELVNDSRSLIAEFGPGQVVRIERVPESLRVPNLIAVKTADTHVNLIVYKNPDTTRGYRVWVVSDRSGFNDRQTPVEHVTRYSYCGDYPIAPDNRP